MQKIEVKNLDAWVHGFLRRQKYEHKIIYNRNQDKAAEAWQRALTLQDTSLALPLGFYEDELEHVVLAQGVSSRAAAALGLPETTYRRRLQKARLASESVLTPRPPGWDEVRQRLEWVLAAAGTGEDLPGRLRGLLLDQLEDLVPGDDKLAAGFMGVTEMTYRRWVERREIA